MCGRRLNDFARKCCLVLALTIMLVPSLWLVCRVWHGAPAAQMPDTNLHVPIDGDVFLVLANRTSRLNSIAATRTMIHEALAASVKRGMWDDWLAEELPKFYLMHHEAMSQAQAAQTQLHAWIEDWKLFEKATANSTVHARAAIDESASSETEFTAYLRELGLYHSPQDDKGYIALCGVALVAVDHIVTLSRRASSIAEEYTQLYSTLGRMLQAAILMSNTTGSVEWSQARVDANPTSCLAQNKSITQCGTENQRKMMSLISEELADYLTHTSEDYYYVRRTEHSLERECKNFQLFQLSRQCDMPVRCTDVSLLSPRVVNLSPQESFKFISSYTSRLLQRGIIGRSESGDDSIVSGV